MGFGMNESSGGKILQELEERPKLSFPIEAQFLLRWCINIKKKNRGHLWGIPKMVRQDREELSKTKKP